MKILNNWDLLNLDGKSKCFPVLVDGEIGHIRTIANSSGNYLNIDYNTGKISNGTGCDISHFHKEYVLRIVSRSGCLIADVIDDLPEKRIYAQRGVTADSSYVGFQPIYNRPVTAEQEKFGAITFRTLVCGILDLCNANELIQSTSYPEVAVKMDSTGRIVAIGNPDTNEYLSITDSGYDLSEGNQELI